ncbi:MAG: hypothetical protein EA396_07120 [Anaerolineaceae bacterium]|nr:MAG: hypothetical protein EA396_07120 [Anaerolineaceae bacterium]
MPANVDAMVKEAIRAYRSGRTEEARTLLLKATEIDESHEQAWMWLSAVVDSVDDQIVCLENVLLLNPDNQNAKRGLDRLRAQQAKQSQQEQASPFTSADDSDWGGADGGAGDFMAGLDIGIEKTSPFSAAPDDNAVDSDYQTGYESAFDDAILGGYDADDFDPLGDDFDPLADDDAPSQPAFSDSAASSSDDFADTADFISADDFGDSEERFTVQDDLITEDDFLRDDDAGGDSEEIGAYLDDVSLEGEEELESLFDDDAGGGYSLQDDDEPFFGEGDESDDEAGDIDYYFNMIPADIRPTRPPGTDDSTPLLLVVFIMLLVIGNVGMIALLIMNMTA